MLPETQRNKFHRKLMLRIWQINPTDAVRKETKGKMCCAWNIQRNVSKRSQVRGQVFCGWEKTAGFSPAHDSVYHHHRSAAHNTYFRKSFRFGVIWRSRTPTTGSLRDLFDITFCLLLYIFIILTYWPTNSFDCALCSSV